MKNSSTYAKAKVSCETLKVRANEAQSFYKHLINAKRLLLRKALNIVAIMQKILKTS